MPVIEILELMDSGNGGDSVAPAVELANVSRFFGDIVAVDELSFSTNRGEFFSIIGPSGSGKTTTIRMIAGLEVPTEGTIRMLGTDVTRVPPHHRNAPMVFQSLALFPHLDVQANVEYGLRMRKVTRSARAERATRALRLVGLDDFSGRRPDQLSGGQQQRVALARALVTEPQIVLLDEALGSLDAKLRIEMQAELKRLQRSLGITFVHVTHDQSEALAMADRILVMQDGRAHQIGTPGQVFANPASRFVASFVGRNTLLVGRAGARIDDDFIEMSTPLGTVTTRARDVVPGAEVTLVVRADAVSRTTEDLAIVTEATVIGAEYQGSFVTYQLDMGNELTFQMDEHETLTRGQRLKPGDKTKVGWKVEDAYALT
jgi:ABC-type Fe3+/spermidine/putrescine transport system ATPase subunit